MRLQLSEADRERLGAPEWLDWPPKGLFQIEAEVLQQTFGVDPEDYHVWGMGKPILDEDGNEVLDEDGKPKRSRPAASARFSVWQALRRAGVKVDIDAVDFDRRGLTLDESEPEVEEGKDAESTPTPTSDS